MLRRPAPVLSGIRCPLACLLICLSVCLLGGCGQAQDPADGRLSVVTTIFPQFDFARQINGGTADGRARIRMLLRPGEEIHSYEPTPADIRDIMACDLFIYVGGENDVWVEEILSSMGEEGPRTLRLMDMVDVYEEEALEGMQEEKGHDHEEGIDHEEDHEEGHDHEEDEHVWTSPVNAALITEAIAEAMEEEDPENAAFYGENTAAYLEKISGLDEAFRDLTEKAGRKTLVFGDRFPFRYFAEEYGLTCFAAFPGCSAESEPSAATLAFLIGKVREEKIPLVFSIEFSNGNIARAICEAAGAEPARFYSCHNVTADQMEEGVTWLSMMEDNLEVLERALNE